MEQGCSRAHNLLHLPHILALWTIKHSFLSPSLSPFLPSKKLLLLLILTRIFFPLIFRESARERERQREN